MKNLINAIGAAAQKPLPVVVYKNPSVCLFLILPLLMLAGSASAAWVKPNSLPVAKIVTTTTLGAVPFTTAFDATTSRDPDGVITSYRWAFGDGGTATGSKTGHLYAVPGTYNVALTVTDDKGAVSTTSVAVTVITAPAPTPIGTRPVGIYSLDKVLDLPYVSGVTLRPKWSDIEPIEGVYDFSKIEPVIRQAVLIGQSITIATRVNFEPTWLLNKTPADNKYSAPQGVEIVPWDEYMLQAMAKLAIAQSNFMVDGVALKDLPNVKQIDAPVGTANAIRLVSLPKNYTANLYKASVKRSIRIWANAYPDKLIYTAIFGIKDGTRTTTTSLSTGDSLRDELLAEFNGIDKQRINFFAEYWTGLSPVVANSTTLNAVKDETSIMMQACGSWTGQTALVWAQCNWFKPVDSPELGFNNAITNFNSTYFELYQDDLLNPNYTSQFEAADSWIKDLYSVLN